MIACGAPLDRPPRLSERVRQASWLAILVVILKGLQNGYLWGPTGPPSEAFRKGQVSLLGSRFGGQFDRPSKLPPAGPHWASLRARQAF